MDPARPTARRIFLCARYVNQFTFARRERRYDYLTWFPPAPADVLTSGLRLPALTPCSRPGTSPWLGPPASKAGWTYPARPHLRAGFFARTGLGARPAWRSRCTWWSDCLLNCAPRPH